MNSDGETTRARSWAWGACLVVGWVTAFFAAFGIATALRQWGLWPEGDPRERLDLAALLTVMGSLGAIIVVGIFRIVFGRWPVVAPWHVGVLAMGIALAVFEELTLHEWARVHIGQYEFDYMGPTAVLSLGVTLVAVASFAVLLAPSGAKAPPLLGLTAATLMICLIVLGNVPGLADGIEPESWRLAVLIGLCGAYAIGAVGIGVRSRRPR